MGLIYLQLDDERFGYKCPSCVIPFRGYQELLQHFNHGEYHSFKAGLWRLKYPKYTNGPIYCFRCDKVISNLIHHFAFTEKHNVCWACEVDYSTAEILAEHIRGRDKASGDQHLENYLKYNRDNCYHCKVCYMIFPSLSTRRQHECQNLVHGDRKILKYASSVCYDPSLLDVKERSGWMYCHRCSAVVSTKGPSADTLEIWKNHKELSSNHNVCHTCRLDFPTHKSLEKHIDNFHTEDFVCPEKGCRRIYKSLEALQNHCADKTIFLYPWGEHVDFQCDYCREILGSLEAWKDHMKDDLAHISILGDYELDPLILSKEQSEGSRAKGDVGNKDTIKANNVGGVKAEKGRKGKRT